MRKLLDLKFLGRLSIVIPQCPRGGKLYIERPQWMCWATAVAPLKLIDHVVSMQFENNPRWMLKLAAPCHRGQFSAFLFLSF